MFKHKLTLWHTKLLYPPRNRTTMRKSGGKKILFPWVRKGHSDVISGLVNLRKSTCFPNWSLTYHSFEPSAQCWRKPGEEFHAILDLSMEQSEGQPLPSQHEQLGCQHFFVSHLQEGLKAEKPKRLETVSVWQLTQLEAWTAITKVLDSKRTNSLWECFLCYVLL